MHAGDKRTATKNVGCWRFILQEKNSEKPLVRPMVKPELFK